MMNYDTFTFERKSHYNEYCPDTKLEFVTHREENLDDVLDMIARFLVACGYNYDSVRQAMNEFGEY